MRNRDDRQAGFTLMEMMVALVLAAIAIAPMYVITRGMARESNKQQMETEAMQRSRVGLEMLVSDFQRAGMWTSPSPSTDPDSLVSSSGAAATQQAYNRQAVVHLNKDGSAAFDSVILVGAFLGSDLFRARVGVNSLTFIDRFPSREDCVDTFSPNYSFAHIYTTTGQTLDAKISQATCDDDENCECQVQLAAGELYLNGPGAFADGQVVHVAASQAALYSVEAVLEPPGGTHFALMRQLINYDSVLGGQNSCTRDSVTPALIDSTTAIMIADYVQDFQVWFRAGWKNVSTSSTEIPKPSFQSPDNPNSFMPDAANTVIGRDSDDPSSAGVDSTWLDCAWQTGAVGPQHLKSALIRLAVRTERTDQSLRTLPADWSSLGQMAQFTIAPPPTWDVGAYKIKTLMTEIQMPNLIARQASFSAGYPVIN